MVNLRGMALCMMLVSGLVACDGSPTAPSPVKPVTPVTPVTSVTPDFIGQVLAPRHVRSEGNLRRNTDPVQGVTVTIVAGPRAGEQVETDHDGRYTLPELDGDELHLRLEKYEYEPKEVIVHRIRATTLPDRLPLGYNGPQNQPGTVLIGLEWPRYMRPFLQRMHIVPDLLRMFADVVDDRGRPSGYYGDGVIAAKDLALVRVMTHELCHAHQHAVVSPQGSSTYYAPSWASSLEGKAYQAAREADIEKLGRDTFPGPPNSRVHDNLLESAAEVCASWLGGRISPEQLYSRQELRRVVPNRLAWADKWLPKK